MRAKYINEKFDETSDPIADMGIGAMKMWKKVYDEIGNTMPKITHQKYFKKYEKGNAVLSGLFSSRVYLLYYTIGYIINHNGMSPKYAFQRAIYDNQLAGHKSKSDSEVISDVQNVLLQEFGIDVTSDVPYSIRESFVQDSDPIEDMGVGTGWANIKPGDVINPIKEVFLITLPINTTGLMSEHPNYNGCSMHFDSAESTIRKYNHRLHNFASLVIKAKYLKNGKLYLELIPLGSYTRCKNEYYNLSKLASNEHTWKNKYIWARSTQDIDTWIEFFDIMG